MKSIIPHASSAFMALCLLLLAVAFPPSAPGQNKAGATGQKNPPADKTLSSSAATVIAVTPRPDYLSPLELEILDEMNLARTEPQRYATFVQEFKKYYDGAKLQLPGKQKALLTTEGVAAVNEAINFLQTAKPLSPLAINRGMCLAAKDHANDIVLKGVTGHRGSDGSSPNARLERYGSWEGVIGENIVYDVNTARQIVIGLIIDDGTANRGHRRNIFDPNHRVTGVSITDSPDKGARCVLNYAGGFQDKAALPAKNAPPVSTPNKSAAPRKL